MEAGNAGSGVGQCVGGAAVVAQDLEARHPDQSVFNLVPAENVIRVARAACSYS